MAIAGTVYLKIDGTLYSLRGNCVVSLGNKERETIVGQDSVHGSIERPRVPYIQCDLTDQPEVDINDLENLSDVTVTVELANGKVGTLRNADQVAVIELATEDGTLGSVRFEGKSGEWS